MNARSLIDSLRQRVVETLRPHVAGCTRIAMLEFPNYPNVGDSAIYLGQLAALRALGREPSFVCDLGTYDRRELARHVDDDTVILLTGGGSFGDLWPTAQRMREDVIRSFAHVRIVQLPQTIHFQDDRALQRARTAIADHPRFTLLARDHRSAAFAREAFEVPVDVCPDMAFALGPLSRPAPARRGVQWLLRTDKESAVPWVPPGDRPPFAADWVEEPSSWRRAVTYSLMGAVRRPLMRVYEPLAKQRLARGLGILSQGDVVVTDRLHGHILALLLGIPHVLLDNSYGKLASHLETWMRDVPGIRVASTWDDAAALADTLRAMPRPVAASADHA
jgi:exopolysaccharide biosynthesis predicted pyruvyltransferase EpsI